MSDKCYVSRGVFYINYASLKGLPLDDYKELHREYWKANAEAQMGKLPIRSALTGEELFPYHMCFACEYAMRVSKPHGRDLCSCCPIPKWRKSYTRFSLLLPCIHGAYLAYCRTDDSKYALEIANMEWEDFHEK